MTRELFGAPGRIGQPGKFEKFFILRAAYFFLKILQDCIQHSQPRDALLKLYHMCSGISSINLFLTSTRENCPYHHCDYLTSPNLIHHHGSNAKSSNLPPPFIVQKGSQNAVPIIIFILINLTIISSFWISFLSHQSKSHNIFNTILIIAHCIH